MRYDFLKNFFFVFFFVYAILIATKFVFYFYFHDNFASYNLSEIIYAIFWGYRFDFATSGFIAFFVSLFDFRKKLFAIVASFLVVAVFVAQIGDIFYFSDASRHVGYEIFDIVNDAFALLMTGVSQHTVGFALALVVAVVLIVGAYKLFVGIQEEKIDRYFAVKKVFLIAISVFFIRGMWQHIPLNPWQANQIGDTKLASLALNGTYNMVFSLATQGKKLKPVKLPNVPKQEIRKAFAQLYADNNISLAKPLITTKPNVIFFFLESWSAKFLKPYGFQAAEATPNFDALLQKSLRPRFMVASGHRTTEGMFATLVSFQNPLGKSVAKTQLQDFKYDSIIDEFDRRGYISAFFQGTSKETSGTGSLANSLGFRYSYGKRDVKKRIYEENYWGVHDEDLYNFVLQKLSSTLKEPFVLGINGATTHDEKLPKAIQPIRFVDNETINKQLNVYHFADYALGKFIKEVEHKYPNTIFVLFADHCGGHISGSLKNYEIPFAIYAPRYIKPKYRDVVLSQRDIAPTVADIVLGDYKKIFPNFSGKSLVRDKVFFGDYYHNGLLGIVKNDHIVEYTIAAKKLECFNLDAFDKKNVQCSDLDEKLKKNIVNFTGVSQKLLFDGKVNEFHRYRY